MYIVIKVLRGEILKIPIHIVILSFIVVFTSFIVHMPTSVQEYLFGNVYISEPIYSDCVAFYNTYLSSFNTSNNLPIPYINYFYPHPPLIGLLFLASYTPIYLLGIEVSSSTALVIYYLTYTLITGFAYFLVVIFYSRITGFNDKFEMVFLYPSFIIYLVYDWTIFALLLILLITYFVKQGKLLLVILLLGLIFLLNPLFIVFIISFLYTWYIERNYRFLGYGLFGLFIGLLGYLLTLLTGYGILSIRSFFNGLFCMNCIYALFIRDVYSQYIRALALGVVYGVVSIILLLDINSNVEYLDKVSIKSITIILFATLFWLYMVPQVYLYLLPLIYLFLTKYYEKILLLITDILNALIIILWFKDQELRHLLSFTRIPVTFNPWSIDSPIQWIAQARNIFTLILLLVIIHTLLKQRNNLNKPFNNQRIYGVHRAGVA